MIRANLKKAAALALTLTIAMSSTAFAASNANVNETNATSAAMENCKGQHHPRYEAVLKKLGLTEQDVINAQKSGKTLFDLAKEKGYTADQVRAMMIESKTEHINKAVKEGRLTQDQANKLIEKVKARIQNWDGKIHDHEKCREHCQPQDGAKPQDSTKPQDGSKPQKSTQTNRRM
ncbi:MAG: hypothetical protein Q8936_06140 [Bacillota bacterium]|nr:hypothetical protein [Bacillota bacterium]